jgi:hypothetical protein
MEKLIERAALSIDEVPSFHIGRRRLILKEDLDRFLQDRKAEAGA